MTPLEIVHAFNDAITAADAEGLGRLMTDDHRFTDPAGTEIAGRAAVLAAWAGFFAAFPGYRNLFDDIRTAGDTICLRGVSECSDPRLDGPALWRATLDGGR
ncbi:MAG: nuclear transport factor 2 family protein, partial [Maritimibacter sp.]|nr:nuclear transport factor 2 family protein [Maritimibacter sp.]